MNPYQIIKRPVITEKISHPQGEGARYAFEVDRRANKIEITQAIEQIFKVKVAKLRTLVMPGKRRRFGVRVSAARPWKKAVATLKAGERIEIYEGV